MKTFTNALRVISVVALMITLYTLYKQNNQLQKDINIREHQVDSLKQVIVNLQF